MRSGPPAFPCCKCGKEFRRKSDMNRHARIHDPTAARFHCPFPGCEHATLQKSNLSTHYHTKHLKARTHNCRFDDCEKSYLSETALIRHEKDGHGFYRKGLPRQASLKSSEHDTFSHGSANLVLSPTLGYFDMPSPPLSACPSTPYYSLASSRSPSPSGGSSIQTQPQSHGALYEMGPQFPPLPNQQYDFAAGGFGANPQLYLPQAIPSVLSGVSTDPNCFLLSGPTQSF